MKGNGKKMKGNCKKPNGKKMKGTGNRHELTGNGRKMIGNNKKMKFLKANLYTFRGKYCRQYRVQCVSFNSEEAIG